jgi:choloylglycine hydrolase
MKKLYLSASALFLLSALFNASVQACTTFCLKSKGEILFGRNYDYNFGDALVIVNKRGVVKTSRMEAPNVPARWTSKYGSVTFNQYGRENPTGGMNEMGLVVELMWLDEAKYPTADARPAVAVLEWIQYHLDTAATTKEVIKNSEDIRIDSKIPLHYLVNDKAGNTAAIEFLDGKLVVHAGDDLTVPALANDTYEKSWSYAREVKAFGGTKPLPDTPSSFDRFTRAADRSTGFARSGKTGREAVDYAFATLESVEQKGGTQWSIVYDQKRGRVYFRTTKSPAIKSIDVKGFDYSCGSPVKVIDVDWEQSGDITARFADYTRQANRDLLERSFNQTRFLKGIPSPVRDTLAAYPETFACSTAVTAAK